MPVPSYSDPATNRRAPWHNWYKLARWRELKQFVHVRDNYVCQKTGVLCFGEHPAPNSPVADHIKAHRGNPDLFWDAANVQTVSKAYHDTEKQRLEQQSLHQRGVWD